ncbi:RagB/SusD family nutrient uptake outer membrane protein [Algivirga pacifica]|uniref:RagB/SusD family nutrient uptake outer membrane protein n=1 Tax=Algivirga pacifica TaxID=1162670 RepID=A0ABP9DNV7_9BACT
MRKILNYTLCLGLMTATLSCESFLDEKPISALGDNGFYQNDGEVEAAVYAIYDGLQEVVQEEYALTEMRSDNSGTKNSEGEWAQFENLNIDINNSVVARYWANYYKVIFRANTILENLDAVKDESLRQQFEGEAKFARAMGHFYLVSLFGDIPLIDKVVYTSNQEAFARVASSAVYTAITNDLTEAAALLLDRGAVAEGRATKGAAQALLAKVYLTQGMYAEAKGLLDALMSSGSYALVDDFNDVFYNELNDEIIFAIQYLDDNEAESQIFSLEFTALGKASGLNYATNDLQDLYVAEDLRLATTLTEDKRATAKFLTQSSNAELCGNDWIVLRYSDVLLMYAEAILAGGNATTDAAALSAVNAVRARAGLADLTEVTKENLLLERRLEFAFENQRWFDLQRFGVAEQVLSAFAQAEGFTFEPTSLLLPIPQREINVSSGLLEQNPGYAGGN